MYNGWSNKETWITHLWLSNDEVTYSIARDIVEQYQSRGTEKLKEWTEACNPLEGQANIYSDLLGVALDRVNWEEIAQALKGG
jgi:hypothetical protein